MANRRKKPAPNASPPKGKDAIKQHLLTTDPTKDYQFRRTNFWGETLIQGLPPWRLWNGRMMIESDPLVEFALNIRNAPLMAAEIDVITNNSQVKNWILKQWNTIWNHHREKVTAAKAFGFTAIQVDWEIKDGILDVKGLKDLAPEDSRCLQLDARTVGWEVKGAKAYFPQACWLTFGSKYGNPYGRGCLRRQYPPWYEKWMEHGAKKLLQLRMIKDAYIGDIFWYPPDLLVQLPDGRTMPWKDVFRELAENRLSGGALVLPRLLDDNGKPLTDYTPPQDIGGGSQIFEWKDQCDKDILKGADIPIEVVEAQETGSGYSGRSVPFLTMLGTVNSEFSEIVHALDEAIFRPGVWLNFGNDVDYEIIPKNIVETFGDDTQGSPMGGEAIGGTSPQVIPNTNSPQQQAPPPGNGVQFAESNGPFRHISTGRVGDKVRSNDGHFGHITGETKSHFHVEGESSYGDNIPSLKGKTYKWKHKVMKESGKQRGTPTRSYVIHLDHSQHEEEAHSFSCLLFKLDDKLKLDVLTMGTTIPSQDLYGTSYGNETETGRELNPHVTLKYGIHTDDVEEVREAIQGESPIAVQFGNTTCFYSEDHDVVKIEVESKQLHALNKTVCEKLECTDTFPEYKPHVTIAYVKKGLGDYYARRLQGLNGKVTVFDQVVFSNKERQYTNIPLTGSAQFAESGHFEHLNKHGWDTTAPGGVIFHHRSHPGHTIQVHPKKGTFVHKVHNRDYKGADKVSNLDHYLKSFHRASQHAEDKIPGGLADKKKPEDFDPESLAEGMKVESEHTSDESIAREIAMDHLTEDKEYYKKLKKMEGSQHAEFESKERGTLHAPPGGVTIHGVKYEGGEFIPKEVLERLTPDERSQVEAGSVARHIKEKPEYSKEGLAKLKEQSKSLVKQIAFHDSMVKQATKDEDPKKAGQHRELATELSNQNATLQRQIASMVTGGIPSNGDTFQHSEEAERIQREFLNEGTAKLVEGAKDRLNALKQTSIEDLAEIHGLIEAEIFKLQPALEMALTASNFKHYVEGMAEIVREVPAEFLPAPTSQVIKTHRSEITEAIATPSSLPEAVAGMPPVKPPGITPISLPEPPPPEIAFPILDDAIRVLEASPTSVGANYRETAELVRQGSFAVTGELVQGQVEQIKEVFQTALEEGHSRDRFIDNVVNTLGEGKLSESHLETVFRTNAMAAKSNGKIKALQMPLVSSAFPYVGYSATHDARTRDEHLELESDGLQGTNVYRVDDPTFIMFRPPWSYNCLPPNAMVEGKIQSTTRSPYSGEVIEITTRLGQRLTVTVNHPIYTPAGYVAAKDLKLGDNVFNYQGRQNVGELPDRLSATSIQSRLLEPGHDEDYAPTAIQEIFEAIGSLGFSERVKTTIDDLHGDAARGNGYVDVVTANSQLLFNLRFSVAQSGGNFGFPSKDLRTVSLSRNRSLSQARSGTSTALDRFPSLSGLADNSLSALTLDTLPLDYFRLGGGSELNSILLKQATNYLATDSVLNPQFTEGLTGAVRIDDIIGLSRREYVGHVYDIQTEDGFMVADGIIISNCRCTFYPVTVEQAAKKGITEAMNWLERAKNLATMEGGSFHLYLKQVAPTSGDFVTAPGFAPSPEFKRA